jgi:predicted permease
MQLRELINRLWGTLRRVRRDAELEEELRLHLEMAAAEARRRGQTVEEAARGARLRAGSLSAALDAVRDQRSLPSLDALASDLVFGWRQLNKHRTTSAAAILSLALAIGATSAAFRLADAVLLRPLPVADPDRLFAVATTFVDSDNRPDYSDDFDYPTYRGFAEAVGGHADLMVVGIAAQYPVTFWNSEAPEVVTRQYFSGNVFDVLGLRPAAGRLFTTSDDVIPGAHPIAVVSHDYWMHRFGGDPAVVGTTFRSGAQQFEIVGVAPPRFTGTEPGTTADLFVPAMMNAKAIDSPGWSWFRIWIRPRGENSPEQVRHLLQAKFQAGQRERAKHFSPDTPREQIAAFLREDVRLVAAGSGVSAVQKTFRRPLWILAALAGLVLLIACANVANLLTAQALARTREMALRASIGAGRWRLIQLVLVESGLLAIFAVLLGALFASWSAPLIVSLLAQVDRPVRVVLEADLRTFAFGVALTLAVTMLFGLAPALRASSVKPLVTLKGDEDPYGPRRLMHVLTGAQIALCVFLLLAAGLFTATFERLVHRPLGFAHKNLLMMHVESRTRHSPDVWMSVADELRRMPGVDSVALAGWAPLTGNRWRTSIRVPGGFTQTSPVHALDVSPGYFTTLRIDVLEGRDFRAGDLPPRPDAAGGPQPGVGIVNEAFARAYFDGQNPVGRRVTVSEVPLDIVGLVRDAAYFSIRESMSPTVYLPISDKNGAAVMVRVAGEPAAAASSLRLAVSRARRDLQARAAVPLTAFVDQQMVRERLLAALSVFFAIVALALAGIGLYGVLNYSVIRARREIGIRMALGAQPVHVIGSLTLPMLGIVCVGALIGVAGGIAFSRIVQSLLFEVRVESPGMLTLPVLVLGAAAVLAAIPAALRAAATDPALTLKAD